MSNSESSRRSDEASASVSSAPVRRICQGPVMPIGGAEDLSGEGEVLKRFLELAGGKRAQIVVIPTASEDPQRSGEGYAELFREMGAKESAWLDVQRRADANGERAIEMLAAATSIFITGGDQARLVALLGGTRAMECTRLRNAEGVVVAGTSAGASIVASHMLLSGTGIGGNSSDAAARRGLVEVVAGFGLLQDVIVDQHFSERGRMGRLLSVFAANPGLIGVGLDEDTAVLVSRDGVLETLGSGMVTIIDGRNATSDYFEREMGEVLTVCNSSLHVLGPGRRFDLDARQPIDEPAQEEAA
ncbi:MAG: cyanophycinase [Thermomicrobiales bacterium]|nr:cyanophycinase [Thermomicrobiales bacterium]